MFSTLITKKNHSSEHVFETFAILKHVRARLASTSPSPPAPVSFVGDCTTWSKTGSSVSFTRHYNITSRLDRAKQKLLPRKTADYVINYTSFCSPHLCCNLAASRVAKRRMGLCLGEKRNYASVQAVSLSHTKYLSTSNSIRRPHTQSESPPWCRWISISTPISCSAYRIRASLT